MTAGGKGDGESDRAAGAAKELEVRFHRIFILSAPAFSGKFQL